VHKINTFSAASSFTSSTKVLSWVILTDVVAAGEQAHPQQVAVDDVVDQWLEWIVRVDQRQHLDDCLGRDAGQRGVAHRRDVDFGRVALLVGCDGQPQDFARLLAGIALIELDVRGAGDLGDRHSGDDGSVVLGSHLGQAGHDALIVYYAGIQGAGDDGQLLRERVGSGRNAVAHHHLVAGAADAHQVDAFLGPGGPGFGLHAYSFGYYDFAQHRIMAMHGHVDCLFLEHTQVGGGHDRRWRAEQDVRQVGSQIHASIVADGALDGS
jgi:hypothetical protein